MVDERDSRGYRDGLATVFSPATFLLQRYYRRPYKIYILDIIIVRSNPCLSAITKEVLRKRSLLFCCKALKESGIRADSQKAVISRLKAYDPFWRSTFGHSYATILLQKRLTKNCSKNARLASSKLLIHKNLCWTLQWKHCSKFLNV